MRPDWGRVRSLLDDAIVSGVTPSAALAVGRGRDLLLELYAGRAVAKAADCETTYDLSSLTKVLSTTALAITACARGELDVDASVSSHIPEFASGDRVRAATTVRDLLTHCSGLPAHRTYFLDLEREQHRSGERLVGTAAGAARILAFAACEPFTYAPRTRAVYSDIGFMLLGHVLEIIGGCRLDELFRSRIATPLGLGTIGFVDVDAPRSALSIAAAPCGQDGWRTRAIQGEVQDENAWAMGGIAGHAGLFATLRAVHAVLAEHVRARVGESTMFPPDVLANFWRKDDRVAQSTWALGWDTPSKEQSSAGSRIGTPAFGHLGFTGTSVWIDLVRDVHVVLLTNRIESGGDNTAIRAFRPRIHDAVFDALDGRG